MPYGLFKLTPRAVVQQSMANPILHIKDSYYFEVPKALWGANYSGVKDGSDGFPSWMVKLDQSYLDWQAARVHGKAGELGLVLPESGKLMDDYHHWLHENHSNAGRPLSAYLESEGLLGDKLEDSAWAKKWTSMNQEQGDIAEFRADSSVGEWGLERIEGYNKALSGKILIPQPFGTLKNPYSAASGFCFSKFMVIQVIVALLLAWFFIGLAKKLVAAKGDATKGRFANALEAFLLFMRDDVARPAIGHDGDKYVPLLWSIFFFVLGLNLMGMLPWLGAPTGAFACTIGLALVTLMTGIVMGSKKFGIVGFWTNQVPSMDLPKSLDLPIKSLLFVIEVIGLFIKHGVLAIRLLANMFAGHIVLLGIMAIAFSVQGAMLGKAWWIAAPISVISATLFSVLELGVAFLQAYIFTFLSALFIGAATHHH